MDKLSNNIDTLQRPTDRLRTILSVGKRALDTIMPRSIQEPDELIAEDTLDMGPTPEARLEDNFEIERESATQVISWVRGAENNPDLARRAQEIHGQSYAYGYGYFKPNALTEDGRLPEDLDGTREKPDGKMIITYLLAQSKNAHPSLPPDSSLRVIDIAEGASIEDLPAYGYGENLIYPHAKARLHNIMEMYGRQSVREIAALATVNEKDHSGSYELMRAIIQNAVIKSSQNEEYREVWIAALTEQSIKPVLRFVGKAAGEVIGESTPIYTQDTRAAENLCVTPVIIDPTKVIDGIVDEVEASGDLRQRHKLIEKLYFMTDGLAEEQIGARAMKMIRALEMRHVS